MAENFQVDTATPNGEAPGSFTPQNFPNVQVDRPPPVQNINQNIIYDSIPVVPHVDTFAGRWNAVNKTYNVYFDQALQDSQANSLAMHNDGFIIKLLRHRQLPAISLPHHIKVEDEDDVEQKQISKVIDAIVSSIKRFQSMKLNLSEAIFWGKSASQICIGPSRVAGNTWNSVVSHFPLNGDKLRYKWDGTPGIVIRAGAQADESEPLDYILSQYRQYVENTMLGPAIFLKDDFVRDRFIIHEFEPSDVDYIFELQQSQSIKGLGLRSRYYWTWNLRTEVLSWMIDALQRVGANGMLYAFYEDGNYRAMQDTLQSLRLLVKENVSAFPKKGDANLRDIVQNIEPSQVGYDVMFNLVKHLEEIITTGILGQDLSSSSNATGLGSGVAKFQQSVREDYIMYDAKSLAETLDEDLLRNVILKYNKFIYRGQIYKGIDLPFSIKFEFQINREDVKEKMEAAEALYNMGVPLNMDDLRRITGFAPPKSKANTVINPQIAAQMQELKAGVPDFNKASKQMRGLLDGAKRTPRANVFDARQRGRPVQTMSRHSQSSSTTSPTYVSDHHFTTDSVSPTVAEIPRNPNANRTTRYARDTSISPGFVDNLCRKYDIRVEQGKLAKGQSARYDVKSNRIIYDPEEVSTAFENNKGIFSTTNPNHPIIHEIGIALHSQNSKKKLNRFSFNCPDEDLAQQIFWDVSAYACGSDRSFYGEVFAGLASSKTYDNRIMALYNEMGPILPGGGSTRRVSRFGRMDDLFARAGTAEDCGHETAGRSESGEFTEGNTCAGELTEEAPTTPEYARASEEKRVLAELEPIFAKAPAAKDEIDDLVKEIVDDLDHGLEIVTAPLKGIKRSVEKVIDEYGGATEKLTDIARNLIVAGPGMTERAAATLKDLGYLVKTIKATDDPLGYEGHIGKIRTKSGLTAETQVASPHVIYAKEPPAVARTMLGEELYNQIAGEVRLKGGLGHKLYEEYRVLPPDSEERHEIISKSRAYYKAIKNRSSKLWE